MAGSSHDPLASQFFDTEAFFPEPPPPARGAPPLLTEAEQMDITNSLANIASHSYGEQNLPEGFTPGDWLSSNLPPDLYGLGTTYGIAQQMGGLSTSNYYQDPQSQLYQNTNPPSSGFKVAPTTPGTFTSAASQISPAVSIPTTSPTSYIPPGATTHASIPQHHDQQLAFEPDVLEAAALLQNGSHQRSHSMQSEPSFSNGSHSRPNNSMGPPVGHLRHQALSEFKQDGRRMSQTHANEQMVQRETWDGWIFGNDRIQPTPRTTQPIPQVLQYGTDQQFNRNNQPFVPQNKKESLESMESQHQRYLKAVELCHSNETTRPPSPVFDASAFNLKTRGPPKALEIDPNGYGGGFFRKNRTGDDTLDDDEEPQSAVSKGSARKRKSKTLGDASNSPGADPSAPGPGKRRKSSTAARRDNLTEGQKRENHINSEKKRRKVIQVGFENLGVIVPGLGPGGNLSKSAMLENTVTFLQGLLDGNKVLQEQLALLS